MTTCASCGGLIGRDCWNPQECAEITASMAMMPAQPEPVSETTPSITAPMESEAAPDVSKRAKALSELAALDGETMDFPTVSDGRGGRRPINPEDDR